MRLCTAALERKPLRISLLGREEGTPTSVPSLILGRSTSCTISAHLAAQDVWRLDCVGFELGNNLLRQREVAQLLVAMTGERASSSTALCRVCLPFSIAFSPNGDRGADLHEIRVPALQAKPADARPVDPLVENVRQIKRKRLPIGIAWGAAVYMPSVGTRCRDGRLFGRCIGGVWHQRRARHRGRRRSARGPSVSFCSGRARGRRCRRRRKHSIFRTTLCIGCGKKHSCDR